MPWQVYPGGGPWAEIPRVGCPQGPEGPRAEAPGRRSPGCGVPGEEAKVLDCLPLASVWRSI